jgi:transposase
MIKSTQKNKNGKNNSLQKINRTVAGIDVGADSVFVCAGKADGSTEVKEFSTFTVDLQSMIEWLKQCGVTSVAMESTGVYWIPPYDMLEQAGFEVLLTNAYYLKTVPGRKTDVKDSQWIQQLHSYGLLRGSFRPEGTCLTLRGYVRQRSKLVEQSSSQVNLMHKALSQMNIQLRQVVTDITGDTGMKITRSIVAGERNPLILAQHRDPRCKASVLEISFVLKSLHVKSILKKILMLGVTMIKMNNHRNPFLKKSAHQVNPHIVLIL